MNPGQIVTYTQTIPVNIVFIGYQPGSFDEGDLRGWLPDTYEPIVRYPAFYGLDGRDMGLHYNYTYNLVYKNTNFSNAFFTYLNKIAKQGGLTAYQDAYNAQVNNIQDVTGTVLYIDAPSVETWLARNLRVQPKSYTIVFINWYGYPNFKYHVYMKTNEPDPDTGYNFGALRSSRKMIAWGGSNSRLWFYDLSAGPEAWSYNYEVDNPDLDGNGDEDYRMPPIWEYAPGGYRDPMYLGSDLGLISRMVAIDLLFTTSPLYDPLVTAPDAGGKKIIHVNMMEDDPLSYGPDWIDLNQVLARYQAFQPYYSWQVGMTDVNPIDAGAETAFRIWAELDGSNDCWNAYGTPYAELFCYFDINRSTYIPPYGPNDYVAGFHAFNTTDANLGPYSGLLGFSDDNWIDGTQSYVFQFDTDYYRSIGYGFTTTTIHEGGHHFGMSHPHDGYDYEWNWDFGPSDSTFFAWSGDESNTIMHYMDLTSVFGQFDRDNMYRWEMAGYLNWSNVLLGDLQADPGYASVTSYVSAANTYATQAVNYFNAWNYLQAATKARQAYMQLAIAADILGVPKPTVAVGGIQPGLVAPHEGDPIRFPDD